MAPAVYTNGQAKGQTKPTPGEVVTKFRPAIEPYEEIYKDIHQNPELSGEEERTASIIYKHLKQLSVYVVYEKIGGHGVVGVLKNGPGPTVLLRADMDALPHKEDMSVPYASTKIAKDRSGKDSPIMHACEYSNVTFPCLG